MWETARSDPAVQRDPIFADALDSNHICLCVCTHKYGPGISAISGWISVKDGVGVKHIASVKYSEILVCLKRVFYA